MGRKTSDRSVYKKGQGWEQLTTMVMVNAFLNEYSNSSLASTVLS